MRTSVLLRWISVGVAALASGCITAIDEADFPPGQRVTHCVTDVPATVRDGSGALSLEFAQGDMWLFNETTIAVASGPMPLSNAGAVLSGTPECGATWPMITDSSGRPRQIIPFTADEAAFNRDSAGTARIAIWPIGGFVHENVGYVYFQKAVVRAFPDITIIGVGLARIEWNGSARRLEAHRFAEEPTLLWRSPERSWGQGAFIAPDGYVYLYGCGQNGGLTVDGAVARVRPEAAADPTAYRYYDVRNDRWIATPANAATILEDAGPASVAWSPFLNRFIAVYAANLSNAIAIRLADNPWGPFRTPRTLFSGDAPARFWIRDVQLHSGHFEENGRVLFLTYYSAPDGGAAGIRLVRYRLD